MKELKSVLKEAREAIKKKNYELSLKLCKEILKEDKTNYMALVFAGVSLQETGQSQKALEFFQKAIQANASNPLAWNGLVSYYEKLKTEEAKPHLAKAYLSLINIEVAEKKIIDYSQKLENLCDYGDVTEIVSSIYSILKSDKCSDTSDLAVSLVNILSRIKDLPEGLLPIYEEILPIVLNNQKTICVKYYADYLNLLYKLSKIEDLLRHAKKMHSLFEIDTISLRWICKIFNDSYVESGKIIESEEDITSYCDYLIKLEKSSATALFTRSILFFEHNQFLDAKNLLDQVVSLIPGLLHAWILHLKCCIKLFLFDDALLALKKIKKLLQHNGDSKKGLKEVVDVLMLEVLSRSDNEEDWERALKLSEKVTDESKIPHLIRANINLGHFAKAELLLSDLSDHQATHKLLKVQLLHKQNKYDEALNLLKTEDVAWSEWWMEMGSLYWDLEQYDKSLIPFLKATKLDSSNYKCFLLLGQYYKKSQDLDKARRCYEKAFKINTKCSDAGIELSRIYRQLKKWDSNLGLLEAFTAGAVNKNDSWAWMQLGLHYLEQQEYEKAIGNFRIVIRIDEDNMHCWESLADAYLAKGAYTSALKCYEKTAKFPGCTLYPLLQMAHIEQILGEHIEARKHFEEILLSNKYYVPALKGLSETCLLMAKNYFRIQRLGAAREHAQLAADNLIVAIQQRSDLACLWKSLGDSCLFVTKLPEKLCCMLLPSSFVEDVDNRGNKIVEMNDLFTLATKCYCKSISLFEDNFLFWHDLAACYLCHALSSDNEDLFTDLINKAKAAAQYCVSKDPTYWQHWNLLANIAMNSNPPNYRLAQHSLIKAVIANPNNAVSWTNLGTLYFMLGDYKLANDSFSQAQRSDPNYVNSWIGQALLAENLAHEDAMDLFRHSTQLGMHKQGALGYAHWVCRTLKESPLDVVLYSIHNMHAIPIACDAMIWYTEHDPMNSSAWNMLGILKERMGLKLGALEAFKKALILSHGTQRDFARVNYGRVLAQVGKYPEAVDIFSKVEAATFNSGCALGLALFKDKRYKESYEAYESTLHWLSDDQQFQSDLLVALASMAYMFEGAETAKTLLFQSIQLEKPSPWGFYATLALGLLHEDYNLSELVLGELKTMKDRKDCLQHYAILSGFLYLLQGNSKKSICQVSNVVHKFPDQAGVWLFLSLLLVRLRHERPHSQAAANCAHIAMKLGQTNMDVTKVLCLASLASFINGDVESSLLMAQKSVFCFPNVGEGWALLAASLLSTKKLATARIKDIFKHIGNLDPSDKLSTWVEQTVRVI